jgi:hypothetical protein
MFSSIMPRTENLYRCIVVTEILDTAHHPRMKTHNALEAGSTPILRYVGKKENSAQTMIMYHCHNPLKLNTDALKLGKY